MQSHVDELAGAVRTLAEQQGIRRERIFALGNSEGTLHALNYQVHDPDIPLAGLVLTGPPGRSVGAVARSQLAAQAKSLPNGEQLLAFYDAAVARFRAGEPAAPDPALPEGARTLIAALESPVNLPFARELWTADAAAPLTEVRVPVLIIIGKNDLQVDWQADAEPLQHAAAGRADISFLFPENANHVLKHEPRPREELVQTPQHVYPPPFSSPTTWPSPVTIGRSSGVDGSHLNVDRSAPARIQSAVLTHPLTERRVK